MGGAGDEEERAGGAAGAPLGAATGKKQPIITHNTTYLHLKRPSKQPLTPSKTTYLLQEDDPR